MLVNPVARTGMGRSRGQNQATSQPAVRSTLPLLTHSAQANYRGGRCFESTAATGSLHSLVKR